MDLAAFEEQYKNVGSRDQIVIICDDCQTKRIVQKHKAKENIKKNGRYSCQKCRAAETAGDRFFSEESRKRMSEATSYLRSDETKAKMSAAKLAFYETPAGQEFKKKLSKLAAQGHAEHKFENSKRQGWYHSDKMNEDVFYGSSYELRLCWVLDRDPEVESFDTQIYFEINDGHRSLDFLIKYKDGKEKAIEMKPEGRLTELPVIAQIEDSAAFAALKGWDFEVYTESNLEMNCDQLRVWADAYRDEVSGTDFTEQRKEAGRRRAAKFYYQNIASDKVTIYCDFCKEDHTPLRLTYEKNIERNGKYICEREGGFIAGSKPKKKKVNPYAAEGKKECNKCHGVKLLEEFGDDKAKPDGKATRCKKCRAEAATSKYQAEK